MKISKYEFECELDGELPEGVTFNNIVRAYCKTFIGWVDITDGFEETSCGNIYKIEV